MAEEIAVEVELRSLLKRFAPPDQGARFAHRLPAGATVASLLAALAIPGKWRGFVAVNGRKVSPDHLLAEGDQVHVYPPFLAGG